LGWSRCPLLAVAVTVGVREGQEAVAEQIRHLVKLTADPDVTVHILPVDARISGW